MSHKIIATTEESNMRIDKFLATRLESISRSRVKALIESGCLSASGVIIKDCSASVKQLVEYEIIIPEAATSDILPSKTVEFEVIYEDDHLLVINKPAGLTVHPGAGNHQDTLVNGLIHRYKDKLSSIGAVERPGIVHRLDKDTSGLMVVARNDYAHRFLSKQLATRALSRNYIAIIWGCINPIAGVINSNLARNRLDRTKMRTVKSGGKEAITNYKLLETYLGGSVSKIECKLETGRTHQIRVHLSYRGHPLIGDSVYGFKNKKIPKHNDIDISFFTRQALHSKKIAFIHPESKELMEFEIPLPDDMLELISVLTTI